MVSSHPIHSATYDVLLSEKTDFILYVCCLFKLVLSVVYPPIPCYNSVFAKSGVQIFRSWNEGLLYVYAKADLTKTFLSETFAYISYLVLSSISEYIYQLIPLLLI